MSSSPIILPANLPIYKCTYSFQEQSELLGGWTESFYCSGSTLQSAATTARALLLARTAMMSAAVTIPYTRISQLGSSFRTVEKINNGPNGSTSLSFPSTNNIVNKGLLLLTGAGGGYTQQWLGGIPGTQFGSTGRYQPTAGWSSVLNTFLSTLAGTFYVKKVAQAAPYQKQTGVTVAGAGVFTCLNHGFATGQLVSMGRWPKGFGVEGIWPVTVLTANTFTLQGWTVPAVLPTPTKSSYAQLYAWTFSVILTAQQAVTGQYFVPGIQRATSHRVGRPTGQYSGRRKARVK